MSSNRNLICLWKKCTFSTDDEDEMENHLRYKHIGDYDYPDHCRCRWRGCSKRGHDYKSKPAFEKHIISEHFPKSSTPSDPNESNTKRVVDTLPQTQPFEPQPIQMPIPGQQIPGMPIPGQSFPGQPIPGIPVPQPIPGMPTPGMPIPGQQIPGMPIPGQPFPGQPIPGISVPQPIPGMSTPGMPIPGQSIPGTPNPDQSTQTEQPPPSKRPRQSDQQSGTGGRRRKPPDAPKAPATAFVQFNKYNRVVMKYILEKEDPSSKVTNPDISKKLGEIWHAMTLEEKKIFEELAELDKKRYEKEMKAYNSRVNPEPPPTPPCPEPSPCIIM